MKTALLVLFTLFLTLAAYGQVGVVFDGTAYGPNLTTWSWGQSTMDIEVGAGPNGTNAVKWVQGDEWSNGWTGIGASIDPAFNLVDVWQIADLTITLKCEAGVDSLRIQFDSPDGKKGVIFHPITDSLWHKYSWPLRELKVQEDKSNFDSSNINAVDLMAEQDAKAGKVVYITNWFVTTGPTIVLFNGMAVPSSLDLWTWGTTSVDVAVGAGPVAGTNALRWTQGDVSMGFGWTINNPANLAEVWNKDSLKVKIKASSAVDTVTIMLYSDPGHNQKGTSFVPVADGQWHQYAFPLRSLVYLHGATVFDSTNITFAEVQTGDVSGQGKPGAVVLFTDFWTGNPIFDVIPPAAPTALGVAPGAFFNTITWNDVPGEIGERYNVYYSKNPITDVNSADVVKLKIKDNLQQVLHWLYAPATDQSVAYYYAITCNDGAGNVSPMTVFGPMTNTAKGVPVISLHGPGASFKADGDLSEWAGVTPLHRKPSDGTQYVVSWGEPFTNDADLSFDSYMAVDSANLYVAFDVEDDIVNTADPSTNQQDSPDFHIGLFNFHGAPHTGFNRGAHPDYLIRFAKSRALIDLIGVDSLLVPGTDYYWGERYPTGYTIEARIPWKLLAEKSGDSLFVPVEGYRIPYDVMFNDADALGYRESMLHISPFSDGNSWADPSVWVYTWIGDKWEPTTGVEDKPNVANVYSLAQNYPNPFNPTTQISYSLEKAGQVNIAIYDILGRHITTLVNEHQTPGAHTVKFNASQLSSGVYFYRINAGSFSSTLKMMLMK